MALLLRLEGSARHGPPTLEDEKRRKRRPWFGSRHRRCCTLPSSETGGQVEAPPEEALARRPGFQPGAGGAALLLSWLALSPSPLKGLEMKSGLPQPGLKSGATRLRPPPEGAPEGTGR